MTIVYMPKGHDLKSFLCSLAQEADSSAQNSSVGIQSDMWNGTNTVSGSSRPESKMAYSTTRPSSETSGNSSGRVMREPTLDTSMSSAQASRSHASLSQSQESKLVQTTPETCGLPPSQPLARYDPDTHSWRTFQPSLLLNISEQYSLIWPRWGMTVDGVSYRLPILSTKKTGSDSGCWYRPVARDWKGYTGRATVSICNQLREIFPDTSGAPHPEFIEEVMGWPIGWSELKPLATDKFHQWRRQHGDF